MTFPPIVKALARRTPVLGRILAERDFLRRALAAATADRDRLRRRLDAVLAGEDPGAADPEDTSGADYDLKLEMELLRYKDDVNVHDLPPIYDYWSNKHLLPLCEACGFSSVDEFFAKYMLEAAARATSKPRFVSIGAGNCDLEVRVAKLLRSAGLEELTFECVELNPQMLERGRQDAHANGLDGSFVFIEGDFNAWTPTGPYDAVLANHSLHHVVKLERLFDSIKSSLHPHGYFITNDMIGRNGHQRWPEALEHVQRLWKELPDTYRYNRLLKRHESRFINHDCSTEGFEGIRAQDILPLLLARFDFALFLGFANVVSPFIDRCFGHNFDEKSERDRAFIDRAHAIDEEGFASGTLKPTQMLAVLSPVKLDTHVYARGLTPEFSVRRPG